MTINKIDEVVEILTNYEYYSENELKEDIDKIERLLEILKSKGIHIHLFVDDDDI